MDDFGVALVVEITILISDRNALLLREEGVDADIIHMLDDKIRYAKRALVDLYDEEGKRAVTKLPPLLKVEAR